MKKALFVFALIAASVIDLAMFVYEFTGIIPYVQTKKYLEPYIYSRYLEWEHYDAGSFTGGHTASYGGASVDVPVFVTNYVTYDGEVKDHHFVADWDKDGKNEYRVIIQVPDKSIESPEAKMISEYRKKFTEKDIGKFCKKTEKNAFGSEYEWYDALYSLDMKKCSILERRQCILYKYMMYAKACLMTDPEVYHFENEYGRGFVTKSLSFFGGDGDYYVRYYDNDDLDNAYTLVIHAPDEETAYKIINSVRLDNNS